MQRRTVKSSLYLLLTLFSFSILNADTENDFSAANNLLFFSDHLKAIKEEKSLNYQFEKKGSMEKGFTDNINIEIKESSEDKGKTIGITYFTGDRQRQVPDTENATGNPLIMLFLQRDVREMARLTGGHWRHFQKQIKLALENSSEIKDVKLTIEGKTLPAKEITIHPYIKDPQAEKFEQYTKKYYVFTLTDQLPGMLYEIRTVLTDDKEKTLLEESITFGKAS